MKLDRWDPNKLAESGMVLLFFSGESSQVYFYGNDITTELCWSLFCSPTESHSMEGAFPPRYTVAKADESARFGIPTFIGLLKLATMKSNAPFVTTSRHYAKQVSDLGEGASDDCVDSDAIEKENADEQQQDTELPCKVPSTDETEEEEEEEEEEDDNDTGYRMSVEAHLIKDEWNDEDSLETMEEASILSWRSIRSWNRRGRTAPPAPPAPAPPRVEVYVDIAEDQSLPRTSSASAIRSNNSINPPRNQDLAHLLATVPSDVSPPEPADAFSIQSQSVFTRDDFAQSDWLSAMTTNSGYLGIAVIAVTISVAHPLLFLAAALTALGTATAVGASYDYCLQVAPCCTADQTLVTEDTIVVKDDAVTTTQAPATAGNLAETPPTTASPTPNDETPSRSATPLKSALDVEWVDSHYPKLDFSVIKNQSLDGLNVVQFFDVFFSDTAPYNFREFQLQRGDKNVEYGMWKPVQDKSELSMHPAAEPTPTDMEYRSWLERELHFQAKTNNTFLGPPYATTTKKQRCLVFSKKMAVLEMKTTLADIPFCDRFYVLERWILTADKDGDGVYHLKISSTAAVILTKSCPFAAQIQTKSRGSLTDVGRAWCHMAKQALQLAKQARLDRLQQHEYDDDDDERPLTDRIESAEQAPTESMDGVQTHAEEKKDEEHARADNDENIELVHSFARQTSWVMGEKETTEGVRMDPAVNSQGGAPRTRSLRRLLPKRSPRVASPDS